MKALSRHALFLATALAALAVLAGCADVHQDPAAKIVSGSGDDASQSADVPSPSPASVPF
jgi:hypothetical protein